MSSVIADAQAWLSNSTPIEQKLYGVLLKRSQFFPGLRGQPEASDMGELMHLLVALSGEAPPLPHVPYMGKIGIKREAAGKTRLFAILDSISQRLLQPLHEWLFEILSLIPQDGTYDQLRPLKRLKAQKMGSYDLKSATDRMPAPAIATMLFHIFGSRISGSWLCMMTRVFRLPRQLGIDIVFKTGTPLGALSTWGAFTLYHHLLVQEAAYLAGCRRWFSNYAILGDDLVIGSPKVAKQYKRLLKWMNVSISPLKSIESVNGSYEFASRFIWSGFDVSPISYKFVTTARGNMPMCEPLIARLSEFRQVRLSELFRIYGAGYRVTAQLENIHLLSKKWFRRYLVLRFPGTKFGLPLAIWLMLGRDYPLPVGLTGVLNDRERWESQVMKEWSPVSDDPRCMYPLYEEVTLRPWVSLRLRSIQKVLSRVSRGELIFPYLDYHPVLSTFARPSIRQTIRRTWGVDYRLYDLCTKILSKPLPIPLGER